MKNRKVFLISIIATLALSWLPLFIWPALADFSGVFGPYLSYMAIGLGCLCCSFIRNNTKMRVLLFVSVCLLGVGANFLVIIIRFGTLTPYTVLYESDMVIANIDPGWANEYKLYNKYGKLLTEKTRNDDIAFGLVNDELVFVKLKKIDVVDDMKHRRRYSIINLKGECIKDTVWYNDEYYNNPLIYDDSDSFEAVLHFNFENGVKLGNRIE